MNSRRSSVGAHPTSVDHGLLFIWMGERGDVWQESTRKMPYHPPECEVMRNDWVVIEMPVDWSLMVENNMDPSHAMYLHEGVLPFYAPQKALPMEHFTIKHGKTPQDGFTLEHSGFSTSTRGLEGTRRFTPPCTSTVLYNLSNGMKQRFLMYLVPVTPGRTRVIARFGVDFPSKAAQKAALADMAGEMLREPSMPPQPAGPQTGKDQPGKGRGAAASGGAQGLSQLGRQLSEWVPFLTRAVGSVPSKFWMAFAPDYVRRTAAHGQVLLNLQDSFCMTAAEAVMAQDPGAPWASRYYLPTPSDKGTIALRQWMHDAAGGAPEWWGIGLGPEGARNGDAAGAGPEVAVSPDVHADRTKDILNNWDNHTKFCPDCRKTVLWLDGVQGNLGTLSGLLLTTGLGLAVAAAADSAFHSGPRHSTAVLGMSAVACVAAGGLSQAAAAAFRDIQRGYITGIPASGNPVVNLYPAEKSGVHRL
eukprot:jgi/Mesvir1/14799/Mv05437-RA.3